MLSLPPKVNRFTRSIPVPSVTKAKLPGVFTVIALAVEVTVSLPSDPVMLTTSKPAVPLPGLTVSRPLREKSKSGLKAERKLPSKVAASKFVVSFEAVPLIVRMSTPASETPSYTICSAPPGEEL